MKPKGSLQCSQEPDTGPYPELLNSDRSLLLISLTSVLILFSHLYLRLKSDPLLQVSQLQFCTHFSSCSSVLHVPPITSFLMLPY